MTDKQKELINTYVYNRRADYKYSEGDILEILDLLVLDEYHQQLQNGTELKLDEFFENFLNNYPQEIKTHLNESHKDKDLDRLNNFNLDRLFSKDFKKGYLKRFKSSDYKKEAISFGVNEALASGEFKSEKDKEFFMNSQVHKIVGKTDSIFEDIFDVRYTKEGLETLKEHDNFTTYNRERLGHKKIDDKTLESSLKAYKLLSEKIKATTTWDKVFHNPSYRKLKNNLSSLKKSLIEKGIPGNLIDRYEKGEILDKNIVPEYAKEKKLITEEVFNRLVNRVNEKGELSQDKITFQDVELTKNNENIKNIARGSQKNDGKVTRTVFKTKFSKENADKAFKENTDKELKEKEQEDKEGLNKQTKSIDIDSISKKMAQEAQQIEKRKGGKKVNPKKVQDKLDILKKEIDAIMKEKVERDKNYNEFLNNIELLKEEIAKNDKIVKELQDEVTNYSGGQSAYIKDFPEKYKQFTEANSVVRDYGVELKNAENKKPGAEKVRSERQIRLDSKIQEYNKLANLINSPHYMTIYNSEHGIESEKIEETEVIKTEEINEEKKIVENKVKPEKNRGKIEEIIEVDEDEEDLENEDKKIETQEVLQNMLNKDFDEKEEYNKETFVKEDVKENSLDDISRDIQ